MLILDHSGGNLWGLTNHSICWWIYQQQRLIGKMQKGLIYSFFWYISLHPGAFLIINARQLLKPALATIQNGGFSLKNGKQEWRARRERLLGFEQGFMAFNTICIIVCISCSVSTQHQHGWSVLISRLLRIDKRNTCRYKVILLPAAHVKLFRGTRPAGSDCSCMNGQIIASWFLKAKSLIQLKWGVCYW